MAVGEPLTDMYNYAFQVVKASSLLVFLVFQGALYSQLHGKRHSIGQFLVAICLRVNFESL